MLEIQKFETKEEFSKASTNFADRYTKDAYKVESLPANGAFLSVGSKKRINKDNVESVIPVMIGIDTSTQIPFEISFDYLQGSLFSPVNASDKDQLNIEEAKSALKTSGRTGAIYLPSDRLSPELSGNVVNVAFDILLGRTFSTIPKVGFAMNGIPKGGFKEEDKAKESIGLRSGQSVHLKEMYKTK